MINYFSSFMVDGLNNHFWSLCVEMQFYVAIAIAVLFGGKRGLWIVLPACLLITAIRIYEGVYISIETHVRVDEILAGACVALLYGRSSKWRIPFPTLLAGLTAVFWFLSGDPMQDGSNI